MVIRMIYSHEHVTRVMFISHITRGTQVVISARGTLPTQAFDAREATEITFDKIVCNTYFRYAYSIIML